MQKCTIGERLRESHSLSYTRQCRCKFYTHYYIHLLHLISQVYIESGLATFFFFFCRKPFCTHYSRLLFPSILLYLSFLKLLYLYIYTDHDFRAILIFFWVIYGPSHINDDSYFMMHLFLLSIAGMNRRGIKEIEVFHLALL